MKKVNSLAETLQSIIIENPEEKLLINSYFRIPKENQEFLKKYKRTHWRLYRIFGRLILEISYFLIGVIVNLLLSIACIRFNQKFKRSITKTNSLFISHSTKSNTDSKTDIYFENIPNHLLNKNRHVTILYLNHSKYNYSKILERLIAKNNSSTTLLIPKFMGPIEFLGYLTFVVKAAGRRAKLFLKYRNTDNLKSRLVLNSIVSLVKRETYSNYNLLIKCKLIQSESRIDNIFITLEGHAYEEEIVKQSFRMNPEAAVWLRQHSPISLAQTGVFNMLKSLKKRVNVLTTGSAYSDLLNQYSTNINSLVIGTSKSRDLHVSSGNAGSVLIAPEGTEKSTLDFLKFINALDHNFNKFHFVFRIHPDLMAKRKVNKQIRINASKQNFKISSESLENDLIQTRATLFRGSAVAIESLAFNNVPIYVNFDRNLHLNVFSILDTDFPALIDVADQSSFLKILERKSYASIKSEIYKQLFVTLDTSLVLKLLFKAGD